MLTGAVHGEQGEPCIEHPPSPPPLLLPPSSMGQVRQYRREGQIVAGRPVGVCQNSNGGGLDIDVSVAINIDRAFYRFDERCAVA